MRFLHGLISVVMVALMTIGMAGSATVSGVAWAQASPTAGAPSTVTARGITLRSVGFDLPASDRMFPGGSDADVVNNNCLACHSAGMVLNQPVLPEAVWRQEVEKMRAQFKAPVDEADVSAIVAYLASHKAG